MTDAFLRNNDIMHNQQCLLLNEQPQKARHVLRKEITLPLTTSLVISLRITATLSVAYSLNINRLARLRVLLNVHCTAKAINFIHRAVSNGDVGHRLNLYNTNTEQISRFPEFSTG